MVGYAVKPGWKTTEFWLTVLVTVCAGLLASGVLPESGPVSQIVAAIVVSLTNAGYGISRGLTKKG